MVEDRVKGLLAFQMHGGYGLGDMAGVLVAASSRRVSINQACKDMAQAPDESTIRHHLSKLSMDQLRSRVNHAILEGLSILPERSLKAAMDITPIPYHGTEGAGEAWEG